MNQTQQDIQLRGRKKGSNKVKLNPMSEWAFLTITKKFLELIIKEGRHIKLHISGKKSDERKKILKREQVKQDIYKQVEKVVGKHFKDTISNPKQVIYFFRAPNEPRQSIQGTAEYLKKKFEVELEKNNEIKKLQNKIKDNTEKTLENNQQQVQNPPVPENKEQFSRLQSPIPQKYQKNLNNFQDEEEQGFFDSSNELEYQNTPKPQLKRYSSDYFENSDQDQNQNKDQDLEKDFKIARQIQQQIIQEKTQEQDNNQQIKIQDIQNPFLLDFIDPDLAKVLEKIWYLFKKEFIFELVLMFYAKQNDLNVTNILLNMQTDNQNFPEILQNIFIKKILNNDSRINDLINQGLKQFRYKFQELFQQSEAIHDVEEFFLSIYSLVKPAEENQYNEFKGTTLVENLPQRQGYDTKDECEPIIEKKVKNIEFEYTQPKDVENEKPSTFSTAETMVIESDISPKEQEKNEMDEDRVREIEDFMNLS